MQWDRGDTQPRQQEFRLLALSNLLDDSELQASPFGSYFVLKRPEYVTELGRGNRRADFWFQADEGDCLYERHGITS